MTVTKNDVRAGVCGALVAIGLAGAAAARAQVIAPECASVRAPQLGEPGKDVLWEPTPDAAVERMLRLAEVKPEDRVIDLGSGDGRIPIAAARDFGATAVGVEYNAALVAFARCAASDARQQQRVTFVEGDVFAFDFSSATVVTTYLLPEMNLCLRARILSMAPGTRVAAYRFAMADWQPDVREPIGDHDVFLWIVPARVEGAWSMTDRAGLAVRIELLQSFQKVTGSVVRGNKRQPLRDVTLRGDALAFSFRDEHGVARRFAGTVRGTSLTGTVSGGQEAQLVEWRALAPTRVGAWGTRPALCARYLGR